MKTAMIVVDLAGMTTMVTEFGSGWIQLASLGLRALTGPGIQTMEEILLGPLLDSLVGTTTVMKALPEKLRQQQLPARRRRQQRQRQQHSPEILRMLQL